MKFKIQNLNVYLGFIALILAGYIYIFHFDWVVYGNKYSAEKLAELEQRIEFLENEKE